MRLSAPGSHRNDPDRMVLCGQPASGSSLHFAGHQGIPQPMLQSPCIGHHPARGTPFLVSPDRDFEVRFYLLFLQHHQIHQVEARDALKGCCPWLLLGDVSCDDFDMVGWGNTGVVNRSHIMLRQVRKVRIAFGDKLNVIEHILDARTPDNTLIVKNSIQERDGIVAAWTGGVGSDKVSSSLQVAKIRTGVR